MVNQSARYNIWSVFSLLSLVCYSAIGFTRDNDTPAVVRVHLEQQSKPFVQVAQSFKQRVLQSKADTQILMAGKNYQASETDINFVIGQKAVNKLLVQKDAKILATLFDDQQLLANRQGGTGLYLDKNPKTQLLWHKKLLPNAIKIGILFNPKQNAQLVEQFSQAASQMGLEIVAVAVSHPRQLPAALKELGRQADSILSIPDKLVYSRKTAKAVLLFSYHNRIPLIGLSKAWVKAGALYALDWDYEAIGKQCAVIALGLIEDPDAPIPAVRAISKDFLTLNAKTAKQLKLNIDQSLISDAQVVFQ